MTTLNFNEVFQQDETVWVKWEEGDFDVLLRYVSQTQLKKIIESCEVFTFDKKTHQKKERIDEDKFRRKIADLIIDWRGLTVKKAKKFINVKKDVSDDQIFECTPDNKAFVINEFPDFGSFIIDSAKALHQLKETNQEKEEKN